MRLIVSVHQESGWKNEKMVQIFGSITLILILKTNFQAIVPVFIDCGRTLPVLFSLSGMSTNVN